MSYVLGLARIGRGACRLGALLGVERDYELFDGLSRKDGFPRDARFEMSEEFPNDIRTEDFIKNMNGLLVASARARAVLEAQPLKNNEFLPVSVINHKGRVEKGPFFIVHQVVLQDCIDMEKTVADENPINREVFISIDRLVLDAQRIDADVSLFRMRRFPHRPLFRDDVMGRVNEAGLTGIQFVPPGTFTY
ncbi:imm11 family protein [Corallococcus macrosporus]|uniref:Immunity MXAN-0049 protein domain-containing protein n=1 Tax=Corallococcus macrosporus DSM 14697 TaxID=1189310 RepID=A0A250K2V3_9BACT|nr:DUF1629 domain-containing protein [Corallococcus macrosporus]ATB50042.1 hypothetical protein MYMAC_005697 [Corallococcus macrosporus DSM 14697]